MEVTTKTSQQALEDGDFRESAFLALEEDLQQLLMDRLELCGVTCVPLEITTKEA